MENQNISETKSKTKTNLGSILLLIGLLLIAAGVAMITFFPEEEQTTNQPSEEPQTEIEYKLGQTIELSKEVEDIIFDENLRIKFIGTASTEIENGYTYKAEIYLNNELVNHNFYTGTNIWSSNYAANIKVYKLENTYIMSSFIAKQCGGSDILVFNTDNTELVTYSDVTLEIAKEENKYIVIKCSDCMNESSCQKTIKEVPKLTN